MEFETRTDLLRLSFDYAVTNSCKANTYKFALARSLLDRCRIPNSNIIKYSDIASDFFDYYWVQVRWRQSSQKPKVIRDIEDEFDDSLFSYSLSKIRKEYKEKVANCIKKINEDCFHYVVPIFEENAEDYLGKNHSKWVIYHHEKSSPKNRRIDPKGKITLNPLAVEFFRDNYESLFQMVILQWFKFLVKYNDKISIPIEKIDNTDLEKREQVEFAPFLKEQETTCFYCPTPLKKQNENDKIPKSQIDHFFPFDLIGAAGLWNLVHACQGCNSEKSNKLPPMKYVEKLKERNEKYRETKEFKESILKYKKEPNLEQLYNYANRKRFVWVGPTLEHSNSVFPKVQLG